jgi:hypothetical protein
VRRRDLGSRDGTRVNGIRLSEKFLQPSDQIQVGPVVLQVLA